MCGATQCADLAFMMRKGRPRMPSMAHMLPRGFGAATVPQSIQKIRAQGVAYLPV